MKTGKWMLAILALLVALSGAARAAEQDPGAALIDLARASGTDALYVSVNGETVIDWVPEDGERTTIELMSAFKSLVAIAIGRLVHDGDLESLDTPVHTFYPEWNQGRKKLITVRHLLNHTSGLQNVPNAGEEIYPAPDAVQLALAAELSAEPGAEFSYNNKATNLLAGVIERASGKRMDLYFREKLFQPLGIEHYQWYFDASGRPHAMAGLQLYARDAAKFGQLVLDGGVWNGERLLDAAFIDEMLSASQPHYPLSGLLWWAHPSSQQLTVKESALRTLKREDTATYEKLATLRDQRFASPQEATAALRTLFGDDLDALRSRLGNLTRTLFDWEIGEITAWYADGYLGQYIVIVPEANVVAVRQIRSRDDYDRNVHLFADFRERVVELFAD